MNLQELRDSARSKADEQSTDFIPNVELDRFINEGYRMIYGKIAQHFESYFIVRGDLTNGGLISTSNNVDSYPLPTGIIKLVAVETRPAGSVNETEWRQLGRTDNVSFRNDYYPPREGYGTAGRGWFIEGSNLVLRPIPSSSYQVRIRYVPRATPLVAETDVPVVGEEYHDLIAEFASLQMLRKSGEGIYREAADMFKLAFQNMMDSVVSRSEQPGSIQVTDDWDWVL